MYLTAKDSKQTPIKSMIVNMSGLH